MTSLISIRPLFIAVSVAALAACTLPSAGNSATGGCVAGATQGTSPAGLEEVSLCISGKGKTRSFTVEIARTTQQQAQGMMYRTTMADDEGMIFPFPRARPASFWMKNTAIPLDIIFVRENGTIESIAENTTPYSEDPVASGEAVKAVLELRGGLTGELGIMAGDKVTWEAP